MSASASNAIGPGSADASSPEDSIAGFASSGIGGGSGAASKSASTPESTEAPAWRGRSDPCATSSSDASDSARYASTGDGSELVSSSASNSSSTSPPPPAIAGTSTNLGARPSSASSTSAAS